MLTIIMLNLALAAPSVQAPAAAATPQTLTLPDGVNRPAASIQDFAWLAGTWHGTGLGGTVDEVWSAPAGGAMVGHFRLIKGSKPVFYEIMTLVEVAGSVEMRLKHVNPDMTGWEEKNGFVTFRLAKLAGETLFFDGLTLRRTGADALEIVLALRNRADGTVREETFVMARAK